MFKPRYTLLIMVFCLIIAGTVVAKKAVVVPDSFEYGGTKYVKCQRVSDYPFATREQVVKVKGKPVDVAGTKSFPWYGVSVAGHVLFNAQDKTIIHLQANPDQKLKTRGYFGTGKVTMTHFLTREPQTQVFENALFVTELENWCYISGYPVAGDTGKVASEPSYLWIPNSFFTKGK